jgi:hypothetical protein
VTGSVRINTLTIEGGKYEVGNGGGLSIWGSSVRLDGCIVRDNLAHIGGGLYASSSNVVLEDTQVVENHALSTENGGGGIAQFGGTVALTNSTVRANGSAGDGGGILLLRHYGYAVLRLAGASSVTGNYAAGDGGGIVNGSSVVGLFDTAEVSDNRATLGSGVYNLGDLLMHDTSAIVNNKALTFGGGVYNTPTGSSSLHENARIHDNKALLLGGGIYNEPGAVNVNCSWGWNVLNNDPDEILTEPTESVVTASPAELSFGDFANEDALPGWLTLTLTNTSAGPVWLNTYVAPAGFVPHELVYSTCDYLEPAGTANATCNVTVFFSPWTAERHWKYEAGTWSGLLVTTWNGEQGPVVGMTSTPLTGTLLPTSG